MVIKYLEEHKVCFNYEIGNEPLIELIEGKADACGKLFLNNHIVLYVVNGEVAFSYNSYSDVLVSENQMYFVPIGSELTYKSTAGFKCFMFRLEDQIRFCDCFTGPMLKKKLINIKKESPFVLSANQLIRSFVDGVECLLAHKMFCRIFFDYKRKELLYMFRGFYTKDELALFFYEGLSDNITFSSEVVRNFRRFSTVSALAESLHYTVSGFEKRFKKTFGVSPSKWMREQKSREIYRDVCSSKLNFKQISDKYNFSSTSTFSDFYKTTFGETPGVTRKKQCKGLV